MATRMYALTNGTAQNSNFVNVEAVSDTTPVDTLTIAHTGGKDGNYSKIPACSTANDLAKHHMSVTSTDAENPWTVTFWNNNVQDHQLYYSLDGSFQNGKAIENSEAWVGASMMIISATDIQFFPF